MQLSAKTNRKRCRPARRGTADSQSDPELLIPQLRNFWFCFPFLFCFKLKYPLMAVEGFPDSAKSFQGKRLKTWMVLFILQHRSLLLHVTSPSAIPSRCEATVTPGTFPGGRVTSLQHRCHCSAPGCTWGTARRHMEVTPEPNSVR